MVSTLKKKIDGHFYCNYCKMGQFDLMPTCFYCGRTFSNFEDVLLQNYNEEVDEKMKEDGAHKYMFRK